MNRSRRILLLLGCAVALFITLSVQERLPGPLAVGVLLCAAAAWAVVTLVLSTVEHRALLAEGSWSATRGDQDADPDKREDVRLTGLRFLVHDVLREGVRAEELRGLLSTLAIRRGGSAETVPESFRLRDPKTLSETIRRIEEL